MSVYYPPYYGMTERHVAGWHIVFYDVDDSELYRFLPDLDDNKDIIFSIFQNLYPFDPLCVLRFSKNNEFTYENYSNLTVIKDLKQKQIEIIGLNQINL